MNLPGYDACALCGRLCGAARSRGAAGFCGETDTMRIAWAGLHMGEEPPLVGEKGSGTIFFTGCSLACAFCQNHQISQEGMGRAVAEEEFAAICLALQAGGAANVNLVTGGHFIPSIAAGLARARGAGLRLPALWNSSGYEDPAALEPLRGLVDIWLPDLKTLDPGLAAALFRAPDYPDRVREALPWMAALSPPVFEGEAMRKGLLVRHLVLPGRLDLTREALAWFAAELGGRAMLSVMTQYTPIAGMPSRRAPSGLEGDRYLSGAEYDAVIAMLEEYGIEEGYCQELVPGSDWLPDFDRVNPFPAALSVPVWHWRKGFVP